jgi:excisionase family DNA binding protein
MNKLLTAQELADILNLSVETIWRYTRQKKIPAIELGEKQYRYEKETVLAALTGNGTLVKEEHSTYAKQGGYTYEDYVKLPEEPGCRYEVLEGFLVKEPSPTRYHQWISGRLYRQLADYFDNIDPKGEIYCAPLDMTLTNRMSCSRIFYISPAAIEAINIRKEWTDPAIWWLRYCLRSAEEGSCAKNGDLPQAGSLITGSPTLKRKPWRPLRLEVSIML